jgi:hypothetical protein
MQAGIDINDLNMDGPEIGSINFGHGRAMQSGSKFDSLRLSQIDRNSLGTAETGYKYVKSNKSR